MKERCFKVSGNLWSEETGSRDEFKLFVRGIDDRHAVMVAKDYLRRNGPCREGQLIGKIIVDGVEAREN
jgi:hypothetical protein